MTFIANTKKEWKETIIKLLKEKGNAKRCLNKRAERLLKKITSIRSNMTSRNKKMLLEGKLEAYTDIPSINELRKLVINNIFKPDPYMNEYYIDDQSFEIDHTNPLSSSGDNTIENLQIIHKTTNKLKGILSHSEFKIFINQINKLPDKIKKYYIQRICLNNKF